MTAEEVVVIRTMINGAYPHSKLEGGTGDEVWYVLLKEYKFKPMYDALIAHIKNGNKFAPTVAELISVYKDYEIVRLNEVVRYMEKRGYFDDPEGSPEEIASWNKYNRLNKTMKFIENNTVPQWLQEDINKYYRELHPLQIDNKETKRIGG
ncbi:MAG: replicative helicase loader/inhibitor [Acholeplasmataceae bacterium]|nr:replicative helicase loader/inhibitor [Acholeplasmataceae bacterium]